MSVYNKNKQLTLVTNPFDGITYDFTELFIHLEKHELIPADIAEQLKKSIDTIPLLIDQKNIDYLRDVKEVLINLQDLRDVFSAIKAQ